MKYRQEVAFIDREKELSYLGTFIDKRPSELLFVHGPKSSGKTTLLYRFFEKMETEQKLDVKMVNLREILISDYQDFLKVFFGMDYDQRKEDVKEIREYDLKVFKVKVETLKGLNSGRIDPFSVMKRELEKLVEKGIKPVVIIDELQALSDVYMNGQRELITELFNFFVAMTKERHLAHVIIASSDGYFLDTVYRDSRLKKTSSFFKVDYLSQKNVYEWLKNLPKYSKIVDYVLSDSNIEKIWDTVGGSMWEIQKILTDLFEEEIDGVLETYKKSMRGIVYEYVGIDSVRRELFQIIAKKTVVNLNDFEGSAAYEDGSIKAQLNDMVRNNILYYDPTEAMYYPQGKSMELGIRLYLKSVGEH